MLTVIGKDRHGVLADLTSLLEEAGIRIIDFTGQTVGSNVVFSIHAEPYDEAFRCLGEAGYRIVSHDHLLVRLENHPGALAELSRRLADAAVDMRGLHFVSRDPEACIVALETPDARRAREILADQLVRDESDG